MPSALGQSLAWVVDQSTYYAIRSAAASVSVGRPGPTRHVVGRLGRRFGGARFNRTRLARAAGHIETAFPDMDEAARYDLALTSYEHLFQLGVEVAMGPRELVPTGWLGHIEVGDVARSLRALVSGRPCVMITGHCGNWEFLGYTIALLGFPAHVLYRPLDLKPLDVWLRRTRESRGLTLVDKFGAIRRLPELARQGAPVGFVADQNAGDRGLFVPFFNRLASTYKSVGLLALQFDAEVVCTLARRLGPDERAATPVLGGQIDRHGLRFRFEDIDTFGPADWNTHPDPLFYLTARYRLAIEQMVRRSPEQYLWMHRIWKSRPRHERAGKPMPAPLIEKIRALPWTTEADVDQITARSEADAKTLARLGTTRLP